MEKQLQTIDLDWFAQSVHTAKKENVSPNRHQPGSMTAACAKAIICISDLVQGLGDSRKLTGTPKGNIWHLPCFHDEGGASLTNMLKSAGKISGQQTDDNLSTLLSRFAKANVKLFWGRSGGWV